MAVSTELPVRPRSRWRVLGLAGVAVALGVGALVLSLHSHNERPVTVQPRTSSPVVRAPSFTLAFNTPNGRYRTSVFTEVETFMTDNGVHWVSVGFTQRPPGLAIVVLKRDYAHAKSIAPEIGVPVRLSWATALPRDY